MASDVESADDTTCGSYVDPGLRPRRPALHRVTVGARMVPALREADAWRPWSVVGCAVQAQYENIRSQMQEKESEVERLFDAGRRSNFLRSLLPF
jgi:hypothetical protein